MIIQFPQRWGMTRTIPWSLALNNTVNTGVSYNTPSGGIAQTKFWQGKGMRGIGPRWQYGTAAGMDGTGCGCGCDSGNGNTLLWVAVALALGYFLFGGGGKRLEFDE